MSCLALSDSDILKIVEPMADQILLGASRRDYRTFSAHFSIDLKNRLPPERFLAECDWREHHWGNAGDRQRLCVFRKEKSFSVVWSLQYDQTEDQTLLLVTVALKGGRYFVDYVIIH